MKRIVIIGACALAGLLVGGLATLGMSSAPPAQQMVHKELAIADLTPPAPPPASVMPAVIPPAPSLPTPSLPAPPPAVPVQPAPVQSTPAH